MYKFTAQYLYEHTNKGLDIIHRLLPDSIGKERTNKHFKLREEEKTPSAVLKEKPDCWVVIDYGGDSYNPIALHQYFNGLSFIDTLKTLYSEFGLSNDNFSALKGEITFEDTTLEKGVFSIELADEYSNLDVIGRFVPDIEEKLKEYHFYSVKKYTRVVFNSKTGRNALMTCNASPTWPIFAYTPDPKKWVKLYTPFDKEHKHGYLGEKPTRYVHGLDRLKSMWDAAMQDFDERIKKAESEHDKMLLGRQKSEFLLDTVFIASGGSDGLSIASLGHNVIWMNSEGEQINYKEYEWLQEHCKALYNLPDIDKPGLKYAYKLAETYWSLKTIYLPKKIAEKNGKDFRDWMRFNSQMKLRDIQFAFAKMCNGALKMKFFERQDKKQLRIKPSYLHYFLKVKGFHIYYPEKQFINRSAEQEFIFVRVHNNIVYQEFPNTMRKFCELYMIEKGQSVEVIDLIKSTTAFTDKNLMSLDPIELEFQNFTHDSQQYYFENVFAEVTANAIEFKTYDKLNTYVWNDKIIRRTLVKNDLSPFFEYSKDENGRHKVTILRKDCEYMNFKINTSRVHWRKELEEHFENDPEAGKVYHEKDRFRLTSEHLSDEENFEQQAHFLSKVFAVGYMLHKAKIRSFARMLYIMDNAEKESDEERNGGSGKSMIMDGVDCLLRNRFRVDGMNENLFTDRFLWDGVTKETDYILIEDLAAKYDITFLYNVITSSITVNQKHSSPFELDFFNAPKFALTRNFGLRNMLRSTLRRILFITTSDYYHPLSPGYNEERRVSHDFGGRDLFAWGKNSKQASIHYAYLLQCLQFYLQHRSDNEILAPSGNIDINNMHAAIGDQFKDWADNYFVETIQDPEHPDNPEAKIVGTLNEYVLRSAMQESYSKVAGKYAKTSRKFKEALKMYCNLKGWELNPKDLCDANGHIKRPVSDQKGTRQILEHFFIRTSTAIVITDEENNDDLPF